MLDNITVNVSDLEKLVPNVSQLKFNETVTFKDVISEAKRIVYGQLKEDYINKNQVSYAAADVALVNVRDYKIELYLKSKVVRLALAYIFRQNQDYVAAEVYDQEANMLPLKYFLDSDLSETPSDSEQVTANRFSTLHR